MEVKEKIRKEIERCERIATNDMKSRWLWGYIDGLKFALNQVEESQWS